MISVLSHQAAAGLVTWAHSLIWFHSISFRCLQGRCTSKFKGPVRPDTRTSCTTPCCSSHIFAASTACHRHRKRTVSGYPNWRNGGAVSAVRPLGLDPLLANILPQLQGVLEGTVTGFTDAKTCIGPNTNAWSFYNKAVYYPVNNVLIRSWKIVVAAHNVHASATPGLLVA